MRKTIIDESFPESDTTPFYDIEKKNTRRLIRAVMGDINSGNFELSYLDAVDWGKHGNSLYIAEKFASEVAFRLGFDDHVELGSGAADSAHVVLGGNLTIGEASVDAGIKCYAKRSFWDKVERLRREYETNKALQDNGYDTVNIIGFAVSPTIGEDGTCILASEWCVDLYTYDNLPWSQGFTDDNVNYAIQSFAALSKFHNIGYHHGDAKIKNVASFDGREAVMIDFETSRKFAVDDEGSIDKTDMLGGIRIDLEKLIDSLLKKGFFDTLHYNQDNPPDYEAALIILEGLFVEYICQWLDSPFYDEVSGLVRSILQDKLSFTDGIFTRKIFDSLRI